MVSKHHALWAIKLVNTSSNLLISKLDKGEIGNADHTRNQTLIRIIKEYLEEIPATSYKISKEIYEAKIISNYYLQKRAERINCFMSDKRQSNMAYESSIKMLINSGYIEELTDVKKGIYGLKGRAYQILTLGE